MNKSVEILIKYYLTFLYLKVQFNFNANYILQYNFRSISRSIANIIKCTLKIVFTFSIQNFFIYFHRYITRNKRSGRINFLIQIRKFPWKKLPDKKSFIMIGKTVFLWYTTIGNIYITAVCTFKNKDIYQFLSFTIFIVKIFFLLFQS